MNLTKYSLKCFKYVVEYAFLPEVELRECDKELVNTIKKCYCINSDKEYEFTPRDTVTKKIEKDSPPLISQFYLPKHHNFSEFYYWAVENRHKMQKIPSNDKLLGSLYTNRFVSIDIYHYLESRDTSVYDSVDGTIRLFTNNKDLSRYKKLKPVIEMVKCVARKPKKIGITIFATPVRKELIQKVKSVNPQNINSGSTYRGGPITLWREEELEKVAIHEMIHALEIDFWDGTPNFKKITDRVKDLIDVDGAVKLYESYTETLAVFLHTVLVTERTGFSMRKFQNLINIETNFTLYQAAKILKFFGFKTIQDLFQKKRTIIQKTSAFSYYLVKGALLTNLHKFIDFIKDDINFESTSAKMDSYEELVISSLKNPAYHAAVDSYLSIVKLDLTFIGKTMRMSCLELSG